MKVLLVDGAATWLDSQPADVTTVWEALKTAFLARYVPASLNSCVLKVLKNCLI